MPYLTLVSALELSALQASAQTTVVLDCSSELGDDEAGVRAYAAGHIPGARHVDMDHTLSGVRTGDNGRNPLPEPLVFMQAMSALGIGEHTQVVAYDNGGGLYAARLWWMLRWIGHAAVAVLDGGLATWKAVGLPISTDISNRPRPAQLKRRPALVKTTSYLELRADLDQWLVLDARAPERFRGANETLDRQAGHIPGARNRPYRDNLRLDGRFKPAEQLRADFDFITGGHPAAAIVSQCGSGVSACHNLLAMEVAGLPGAALYPGSWSEWCSRPDAPVATGDGAIPDSV